MLPPLDALRCFVEAARLLNFRAASRAVALTPAALGQRIRQLEQIVGQELFTRTTRRVVLTEAGRALLPHARDTLAAAERCLKAGRGELAPEPQELVLGTRHELGMSWLVPLLPRLRARHPGVTFHLYFGSGADLLARVRSLDVHAAIGSMRVADPRIVTLPLHLERYVLVGSPRLLARRPFARPEDARSHTLLDVNLSLPLFSYLAEAAGGSALTFGNTLALGTGDAVRRLVLAGEGVAVLPEYFIAGDLKRRRLRRLLPRQPILEDAFRLYFRRDDPRRALYEALAETLRREPLR
ncbi:MAG TPA: LysR family transcriptional regulator [Polyangiaceae bacterium]|nr:LysR family transcriptional regulator [Polyangiaceae bacterium]